MTQIVRVLQHDFPIEREYRAGHVLNEAEAIAFNQTFIENIRANVYHWIVKATKGKGVLTAQEQIELTKRIQDYAEKYQFRIRTRPIRLNMVDAAARELARQQAESWGNRFGYSADSTEVYAKFVELRDDPEIKETARQMMEYKSSMTDEVLEGLI